MQLIHNNPYRIVGVLANASARDLQKQKAKIIAFAKVDKEIKSDFDFDILYHLDRSEEEIESAFSKI